VLGEVVRRVRRPLTTVTLACALSVAPAFAATAGDHKAGRGPEVRAVRVVSQLQGSVIAAGGGVASSAANVRTVLTGFAATMRRLDKVRDEAVDARRRAVAAAVAVARQQGQIDEMVRASYMAGGSVPALAAVLAGDGPTEILDRATLLTQVTEAQLDVLDHYLATKRRMIEQRSRAEAAEAEAEELAAGAEAARRSALVAAVTQQERMAELTRQLEKAAEHLRGGPATPAGRARQQALQVVAAQDAMRRQVTAAMTATMQELADTAPHATARQGRVALRWARTQLGVPYSWGGGDEDGPTLGVAGPRKQTAGLHTVGFDCSGLATYAWAQAGVHLDSYTGYQWVEGHRVSLDRLRPGDLVFFARDVTDPASIHHVGVYAGDGLMIDAPHTGAVVRYDSVFRPGLIGAVRP
jgi:cell wall-associated NlpC family hydrolase